MLSFKELIQSAGLLSLARALPDPAICRLLTCLLASSLKHAVILGVMSSAVLIIALIMAAYAVYDANYGVYVALSIPLAGCFLLALFSYWRMLRSSALAVAMAKASVSTPSVGASVMEVIISGFLEGLQAASPPVGMQPMSKPVVDDD